jgi:hypothetical protein
MAMSELSPAAKAVMIAATNGNANVVNDPVYRQCTAAALRAAADQVVPVEISLRRGMRPGGTGSTTSDEFKQDQRCETRRRLLAIATELENHQ